MSAVDFLAQDRTLLLRSRSKHASLRALTNAVCRQFPNLDAGDLLARIEEREREISTLITPGIALPHARLAQLDDPVIAVALHKAGVSWQAVPDERAHLIVLVLGTERDPSQHIRLLADIARLLSIESNRKAMLAAKNARVLYEAFAGAESAVPRERRTRKDRVTRGMLSHAAALAKDMPRARVMIHDDGDLRAEWLDVFPGDLPIILTSRDVRRHAGLNASRVTLLQVPSRGLVPKYRVELAILLAISQGLVDRQGTVINVYAAGGLGGLDALSVVDVARAFEKAPSLHNEVATGDIDYQVLNRVLNISLTLANEGREGKPVGTIFVVGDWERVTKRCTQIVINPFKGYPEDERSILDPSLEETVKEFAAIDGAFLIRGDGVIMAAGACLPTDPEGSRLSSGLGTRHVAAMSITAHTKALSVVISQSTGAVRIFKSGQEVLTLERAGH